MRLITKILIGATIASAVGITYTVIQLLNMPEGFEFDSFEDEDA